LTLARLPREADFAVIEIGMNHPGEIAPLSHMARPDVVVITIVAPAHLEAFDSIEGIAHEKAAIIDGLQPGGVAVLNADIATSPLLQAKAHEAQARAVTFGAAEGADYRMVSVQIGDDSTVVRATRQGQPVLYKVMSPGRHFAANGLAVLAVADALGLDPVISATDLGRWQPPAGRGVRERIMLDLVEETGFDLIDDAFNANPASMAASLEVLVNARPQDGIGSRAKGRRIAILGDMLELGPTEAALHAAIAETPGLAAIDLIHCVGPRMKALHAALPRGQRGDWVATAAELVPRARHLIDAGDIILVKGSKGIKVSLMVDALRKLGQPAAAAQGDA
jgi:UDP-N-acetylmuramoyl-tripeptide--D-alanyl-D-alanine ligase